MIKILIGGSPCTKWSVARGNNGRETEPDGIGWELFCNYLIAKEKFCPDFFLYENNKSASQAIKDKICSELGHDLVYINSGRVSGQRRERFYVVNWQTSQPTNRNIMLGDVLEAEVPEKYWYNMPVEYLGDKPHCANLPIKGQDACKRVYSPKFKAPTLTTSAGGHRQAKVLIDGRARKLTPTEYERLQTMPDGYTAGASDSQRYKALGNGWTAEVIIHLLREGLKDIPRDELIVVLSMYDGIATGRYCLDKLGFTNVQYYAYEIDKYAIQIAKKNYPDIVECGDAFDVRRENWVLGG